MRKCVAVKSNFIHSAALRRLKGRSLFGGLIILVRAVFAVSIGTRRMQGLGKMKMDKVYLLLHKTTCHILLCANLAYLTVKYFAYDTQVDLGFYTPVTLTQPNLSLCFDLNTVLGEGEILVFNHREPPHLGMTSKQIFDRAPGVQEVVKRCAFRDPVSDQIIQVENSTECHQLFTIERYKMHCFICYLFHMNKQHNFSFSALALSLNEPKLLYNVAVEGSLTKGHAVAPLVHLDELPDVDRIFMKEIFPSKRKNEVYHLEYDLYEIERLPHPYKTQCAPEPQVRCLYSCYSRKYAKLGQVNGNSVVREGGEISSFKIWEVNGTDKESQIKFRNKIGKECAKICPSEACSQKLVITHLFGPFTSKDHKLSFNVGSYRGPLNRMKYSPQLILVDYVTQSLNLSGIWVGFSIASLIFTRKRFNITKIYKNWTVVKTKLHSRNLLPRTQIGKVKEKIKKAKNRKLLRCKRFISITFKLIALLIFSMQAFNLCYIYAKYETIRTYQHSLDPEYEYRLPSTAVCLDFKDLFPSRGQTSMTEENYEDILTKKNTWINLTLDQIFDQTIGEEILFKCRTKSYEFMEYFKGKFQLKSGEECLKEEFSFHKYYSRWQMCYLFKPKQLPRNFAQHSLVFGQKNPSKLYSLILNAKIKHHRKIDLILYFDAANASHYSSDFRAISPRFSGKRLVSLTSHTIVFSYLPAPYDTRCNPVYSMIKCLDDCRASKLTQVNRLPYSNFVKEKRPTRLLSFQDLKNSSINKLYWQIENHCSKKCDFVKCSGNYSLTYSRHAIGRTEFDIEVVVSPEAAPRTHARSVPCFELYDFLYQIFCLLAFWLGFSFVGLNFIGKIEERRFKEAARVLYSESLKMLRSLRPFRGRIGPIDHGRADALKRNLLMRRVLRHSICVFGLFLHLFLPIGDYLAYPTKLLTTIRNEKPIALKLIVCSEALDLSEKGVIFGREGQRSNKYLFDRDLGEILTEAKKLNRSTSACGYWGLARDRDKANEMKNVTDRVFFKSNDSSLCDELFRTRVFLRQGHICLEYKLRRKTNWNRSQMLASFNEAKTALSVSVNSSAISRRFSVIAFIDAPRTEPFHTSVWAPTVHEKLIDYRFVVSYLTYALGMLPHPYSDKGFVSAHTTYCFLRCTNAEMAKFNIARVGFGHPLPKNKLMSNLDRNNSLVDRLTNEIDRQCDKKCMRRIYLRRANYLYMVSTISEPIPNTGEEGSTLFELRRTDDPVVAMEFIPAIPIYDLIINIGSIISIWFGLSVISIPDLVSEEDMEKLYIKTVDNLQTTNCILKRIAKNRNLVHSRIVQLGCRKWLE